MVASMRARHPFKTLLAERGVPHVFVNRAVPGSGRNVTMDDEALAACAVRYLHELGHTRIGFLEGTPDERSVDAARARLRTASAELGLEKAIAIDKGDFRERNGVLQARALLRDHPDLSAVITGGPPQAIPVRTGPPGSSGWRSAAALDRQLRRSTRSRLPSALADGDPHAVRRSRRSRRRRAPRPAERRAAARRRHPDEAAHPCARLDVTIDRDRPSLAGAARPR